MIFIGGLSFYTTKQIVNFASRYSKLTGMICIYVTLFSKNHLQYPMVHVGINTSCFMIFIAH
jgi:uncharacterized membrane protein